MNRFITIIFTLLFGMNLHAQDLNLLSGKYSVEELQNILIPHDKWTPFPRPDDRQGWAKADTTAMRAYIRYAENHLDYDWPTVPATLSLLIARTGDRQEYQKISYRKRIVLANMILAELAENSGRFIDPIVNGIWSICEESWWGASAHLPREYLGLMDVSQPYVDLYTGVTGGILAWADYFFGDKFDAISPQIRKRILHEVNYRMLQPLMTRYHGWMGNKATGQAPNNWNPWICSNWITCVLLLEKDGGERAKMIERALSVLDAFLNPYPEDGGCSEGPGYWSVAVGSLYDNVALLNLASNNAFQYVYENEKFRNMCSFVYRVQISEKYAVNFADAGPRLGIASVMTYRIGKDVGDTALTQYAAWYGGGASADYVRAHYARDFFEIFIRNEFLNASKALQLPQDVWLPDLQVALARDRGGSSEGFFFAAKGGTNGESHNHNDIGNFIVYYDGLPLLIDVGPPKYTAMTFTSRRYEIWNLCSDYHNTPTVNGITQHEGLNFKASDAAFKKGKSSTVFSLDIAGAYPKEAGINSWKRSITLNRGKGVTVRDAVDLQKADSVVQHLMTCYPARVSKAGEITIDYRDKDGATVPFVVKYNAGQMDATVEKVKLETESDDGVRNSWGDVIHRINIKVKAPKLKDTYTLEVKKR
ncbi:MAG: heparinase II/III-family protein [Prevotellaceae bacterium]|nr:heparinase II/III-family protein [Prevotellaceae bacterium]